MSLVVTQRPSTTISGETSKWNAVGNPILYKLQRKDFTFNQVNDNSGDIQLQFNAVNVASSFAVGDTIYIKSDNDVYDLFAVVTASAFSTNTLVTVDAAYISAAPGGFTNNDDLKPYYRVEVEIYRGDDDEILTETILENSPTNKGAVTVNVSPILRNYLYAQNDANITSTTETFDDSNVYLLFYIKYREVWTDSAESQTNDSGNQFYAVLAARQIPAPYGGNMAEYVSFDDGLPTNLFLTKFENPIMWRGYPFLISAIVGESINDNTFLDCSPDATTPANNSGKIIQFDLNQIVSGQDVETIEIFLKSEAVELSSGLEISLHDVCSNPVLLLGRNTLGGSLMWMFEVNQEYTFDYGNGRKAKRMTLFAEDLTINQWESLQDFITLGTIYRDNITELTSSTIKTSTRVGQQVYVVDEDGNKTGVIVIPTRNRTETRQIKHSFEIEIEFPEEFAL